MREKSYIVIGLSTLLVVFVINMVLLAHNINMMSNMGCIEEKVDYEYLIHYYHGYNMYDIISYKDDIKVITYAQIKCEVKNCSFPKVNEYNIKKLDKYNYVFDVVFRDRLYNEMTLYYESVDESYKAVLEEMIGQNSNGNINRPIEKDDSKNNNTNKTISDKYEIFKTDYYSNYKARGYYYLEDENVVVIAMGARNTGGYGIDISNVQIAGDDVTLYVVETSPKRGDAVTQAFTYPSVSIKFNFKPGNIIVINEETKVRYERRN